MQRYDDFKLIRITCQAACQNWTWHICQIWKTSNFKLQLSSPSRVSPYPRHITVPFCAKGQNTFRSDGSGLSNNLLPEACSLNGIDNRQQIHGQTRFQKGYVTNWELLSGICGSWFKFSVFIIILKHNFNLCMIVLLNNHPNKEKVEKKE